MEKDPQLFRLPAPPISPSNSPKIIINNIKIISLLSIIPNLFSLASSLFSQSSQLSQEHKQGIPLKVLQEIKELTEERNSLTEEKRRLIYRKGFDTRLVDMNRTCKVTKGGQIFKYTAMLVCGNYNGVIGFAKGKIPAAPIALQKAYERCFQNLHYVERHEDHTITHAVQTE